MSSLVMPYEAEELCISPFLIDSFSMQVQHNDKQFLHYIWDQFLILFEKEKGKRIINNWFKCLEIINWNTQKKVISLYAPNKFVKNWLEENFLTLMEKTFARLLNEKIVSIFLSLSKETIEFCNKHKILEEEKKEPLHKAQQIKQYEECDFLELDINPHFTMDKYLILKSNETVITAIQYFVEKNNHWNNILFISGKSNTGKTHLLQAMRELFLQKDISCLYIHAETFLKQYVHAAKMKQIDEFEKLFLRSKILMIDDIDILQNKKYTQEFLLKLLNHPLAKQKKIIFSSKFIPKDIHGLSLLVSEKIEEGLMFQFEELHAQDIKNILILKAKHSKYVIEESLINYISQLPNITLTQCESILHRVMTESIIKKKKLTFELLQESLQQLKYVDQTKIEISSKKNNKNIHTVIDEVILHVKKHFIIDNFNDVKVNRNKHMLKIKYLTIYILRNRFQISCVEIAKYFQYKDHTTIGYAIKKFELLYKNDEIIKKVLLFYP